MDYTYRAAFSTATASGAGERPLAGKGWRLNGGLAVHHFTTRRT
jgi:hypothetical protein